jgi:hypothetical protein
MFTGKCVAARGARVRPEHDEIEENRCVIVSAGWYDSEPGGFITGTNILISINAAIGIRRSVVARDARIGGRDECSFLAGHPV